ncbi:DUF3388 domain-containing protein [Thermoactinomyces sp. DSM 45892]|uniref:DUF3388 domain-containing protein n=1 Tax=Thermoactinomyces sp. DSM 45892 TaxID=1882753 RepID=UPI00089A4254|nr:DUF3388 domain-containing protein [Thermoactinomyces sp. DSM 45892]SDY48828.1 Protein of unknown function [Thermoactinomyces sp. DSM 45892]
MEDHEWYLEYQIHKNKNRPGLLGDLASLLGMLKINIVTINGVTNNRRGLILRTSKPEKIEALSQILHRMDHIHVTALRKPNVTDRLAVRHGKYVELSSDDIKTYRFIRDEIGILVDFLAEQMKKKGHQLIGIRGMPRVGKTESIVASSVCANKRWSFLSSTLLRQTIRTQLAANELTTDHVYIIDGIVSTRRFSEEHICLLREVMGLETTKVIEHPDIFVRNSEYRLEDFNYMIELRNHSDEKIVYDLIDERHSMF